MALGAVDPRQACVELRLQKRQELLGPPLAGIYVHVRAIIREVVLARVDIRIDERPSRTPRYLTQHLGSLPADARYHVKDNAGVAPGIAVQHRCGVAPIVL